MRGSLQGMNRSITAHSVFAASLLFWSSLKVVCVLLHTSLIDIRVF